MASGDMSQCRTSASDDHLDHSFVVFKDVQHSFFCEGNSRLREQNPHSTIQDASEKPACYTVSSLASLMLYSATGLTVPS